MQERHTNREIYFQEQTYTMEKYIIPFISEALTIDNSISVLEIGCGDGGNLKPFIDLGCRTVGIDMSIGKIENAKNFLGNHEKKMNLKLICKDIYEVDSDEKFDLVFSRDVLEHLHNQEEFMRVVKKFLKPSGKFFLGFPPWQNPFGGHQQMCESKILSKVPYFHILPSILYKYILKLFGEREAKINSLLKTKETGITIEKFEKILKKENYHIDKRVFYFINPNYEIKFKLKPRIQSKLISSIPYLRNFFITTNYYLVSLE
ncbi:MAG: class I SAM-dependent methyltransferase [Bacteroidota bacterium]